MSRLDRPAPCSCCSTVRAHIQDHLDPEGLTTPFEDPATVLNLFNGCSEDGDCGLSLADLAAYLVELNDRWARATVDEAYEVFPTRNRTWGFKPLDYDDSFDAWSTEYATEEEAYAAALEEMTGGTSGAPADREVEA